MNEAEPPPWMSAPGGCSPLRKGVSSSGDGCGWGKSHTVRSVGCAARMHKQQHTVCLRLLQALGFRSPSPEQAQRSVPHVVLLSALGGQVCNRCPTDGALLN